MDGATQVKRLLILLALLVATPVSAQQVIPGVNFHRLVDGAATLPSQAYIQDPDTGTYRVTTDTWGVTTAGTLRLSVSTSSVTSTVPLQVTSASNSYFTGGGSVGIGTTGPTKKLHVLGTAGGDYVGYVQSTGNTGNNYGFLVDGGTTSLDVAFQVRDSTGATSRLYVRGDGNVGIGTTTPTANTLQLGDTGTFGWSDVSISRAAADIITTPDRFVSTGSAAGIGYAAGAGGTVTQLTSKSTGVTLNTVTGEITMNAAALAANTAVSFTLTNSAIAVSDYVMCQPVSGGTAGAYDCDATAAAGSATVVVTNRTAGSLSEAVVIKFVVFKAAIS